jgi:hypothetical protein
MSLTPLLPDRRLAGQPERIPDKLGGIAVSVYGTVGGYVFPQLTGML